MIDHLVHVTKEIDVGEVAFTGSGPVLTQEMLKQVKNEQWLDIFQNSKTLSFYFNEHYHHQNDE